MNVRPLVADDWSSVKSIYEEGIATRNATFAVSAPDWSEWDREHLPHSRFVATNHTGAVLGWAALTPVSNRCVYAGVAEVSVYVTATARGQGAGRHLLTALIDSSETAGLWTLQAGILPENVASIRIHEHCGFRVVGRRERIGQMDGVWRDVVLMERRSRRV